MLKNRVKKLEIVCEGLDEAGEIIPIYDQLRLIELGVIDKDNIITKWTPYLRSVAEQNNFDAVRTYKIK